MESKVSSHTSSSHSSHNGRRRRHRNATRLFLVLHSLVFGFSLLSFSIFAAVIPIWNANFFHNTGILPGDWADGLPLIPLFLAIIVSGKHVVQFIIARRKAESEDRKPSRPPPQASLRLAKIHLYLTLTIIVVLLAFLVLAGVQGLYRFERPGVIASAVQLSHDAPSNSTVNLSSLSLRTIVRSTPNYGAPKGNRASLSSALLARDSDSSCSVAKLFTRKCNPTLYLLADLQITGLSFGSLVWLLNLIVLVFQVRDLQHQKRRYQRSLRTKAKAKLEMMEDEMSRAEKGSFSSQHKKKIHHERKQRSGRSSPGETESTMNDSTQQVITLPVDAHIPASSGYPLMRQDSVRPKQHYYDPNITPSRTVTTRQQPLDANVAESHSNDDLTAQHFRNVSAAAAAAAAAHKPSAALSPQYQGSTAYSRAVDEARKKIKPAETMRDWLAARS